MFSFYEVVSIAADEMRTGDATRMGVIVGISEDEGSPVSYAVLDLQSETTEIVPESRLTPAGRRMSRSDLYDGDALKVSINPETREGSVSDPDGN